MAAPHKKRTTARKMTPRARLVLTLRIMAAAALALALTTAALLGFLASEAGRAWTLARINAALAPDGRAGALEGSLFSQFQLTGIAFADREGDWLRIPRADIGWQPMSLLAGRVTIERLTAPRIAWMRLPEDGAGDPAQPLRVGVPRLPFALDIQAIRIDRLETAAALTGEALAFTLDARLSLSSNELGDTRLQLKPLGGSGDSVDVTLAIDEANQAVDLSARIAAPKGGLVNRLTGLDLPLMLRAEAVGPLASWTGGVDLDSGALAIANLTLQRDGGHLLVDGRIDPSALLAPANRQSLGGDYQLAIDASATTRDVLLLAGIVEGPPGSIAFDGGVGFRNILRFEDMAVVVDPNPGHAAQIGIAGIAISKPRIDAILNGPLRQPLVQARLAATQLAWDGTGIGQIEADMLLSWQQQAPSLALDATARDVKSSHPALAGLAGQTLTLSAEAGMDMETRLIALRHAQLAAGPIALQASGDIAAGLDRLDLALDAQLADLDMVQAMTGQPVSGTATLGARLARTRQDEALAIRLDAAFDGLRIANQTLRGLLGAKPRLTLEGAYLNPASWQIGKAVLENAPLAFSGNARARPDGPSAIAGNLKLAHRDYGEVALRLQALTMDGKPQWEIAADGTAMGAPLSGRVIAAMRNQRLYAAERINLDWGNVSLTGQLAQEAGGGLAGTADFLLQPGHRAQLFGISGDAQGQAALRQEDGTPVIQTRAAVKALAYSAGGRTPLITGPGTLDALLRLDDTPRLNAQAALDDVLVAGRTIDNLRFEAASQGAATDFSAVASFGGLSADRLDLSGRFAPDGDGHLLTGQVTGQLGGGAIATRQAIALGLHENGWRLAPLAIDVGAGSIEAEARQDRRTLALDMAFDSIASEALAALTGALQANGDFSGKARFEQSQDRRDGVLMLALDHIRSPRLPKDAGFAIRLTGDIVGQDAQLNLTLARAGERLVEGVARMALTPVQPGAWPGLAPGSALDIHLHGETPLAPLWALVPADRHSLTGLLAIDINVGGRWDAPLVDGTAALKDGRYENLDLGTRLHDIAARLAIGNRHLRLESLSANDGNGGSLRGGGDLYLDTARAADSAMTIGLDKLRLLRRDDLRATASGEMELAAAGDGLALTGALAIERAEIILNDKGAASIPKVATREINKPAYLERQDERDAPALKVALDLDVSARNQLFFQGMGLNSEWSAGLNVKGTLDDPRLAGGISLVRGEFDFATTRFTLTRGRLDFDGQRDIDPRLDVTGTGERDGLTATVTVGGRASSPRIALSSSPALPEDEILSRLLFGTSVTDLSALEAVQLGSALAALSGGGGGGTLNVLNTARSGLGIDRLTLGTGASGGTTVTGGKYLTDKVYLEVTTEPSTGESSAVVEWDITRRLSLLSRIKQQSDANFAIRWSRDY